MRDILVLLATMGGGLGCFLGKVMSARLPVSVAEYARALLRIADEYESLSDEFPVIVKAYRDIRLLTGFSGDWLCED